MQHDDLQLLAAVLGGDPNRRADLAARLLQRTGSLWAVARLRRAELVDEGLRHGEARRLLAALRLGRRFVLRASPPPAVTSAEDAYRVLAPLLLFDDERERFVCVPLDVKNRPLRRVCVAVGAADRCHVDAREVFLPAVAARATSLLIGHNHPSGDPTPSADDIALTRRLAKAAKLLGLHLLDHLIIAGSKYESLAARGEVGATRVNWKAAAGA